MWWLFPETMKRFRGKKKKVYPKCVRCGVCCLMGPCTFGNEDGFGGICRHLEVHPAGTTSCTAYLEGRPIRKIVHGNGCVLRAEDARATYKKAVKLVAERKEALYKFQITKGCMLCRYSKNVEAVPTIKK